LPPQQHQALLAIAGHVGAEPPSVGVLAQQLMIEPHTAAELVSRMVEARLITKSSATRDRRRRELAITPEAERLLRQLTEAHQRELAALKPALTRALTKLGRQAKDDAPEPFKGL